MHDYVLNAANPLIGRPDDVWVDRSTKWGNPFRIGPDGNREEVLRKHREWFATQHDLIADLESLRGKRLICWCKPEECHADHYVWLLYGEPELNAWLSIDM